MSVAPEQPGGTTSVVGESIPAIEASEAPSQAAKAPEQPLPPTQAEAGEEATAKKDAKVNWAEEIKNEAGNIEHRFVMVSCLLPIPTIPSYVAFALALMLATAHVRPNQAVRVALQAGLHEVAKGVHAASKWEKALAMVRRYKGLEE